MVCHEKENRIQDLLQQVSMLKSLAFPPSSSRYSASEIAEFDALVSGSDVIEVESQAAAEANRILTGNYDSDQVENIG